MTQAVILVGGRAGKAQPLSEGLQDVEVQLCGVAIGTRIVDVLRGCGVEQIVAVGDASFASGAELLGCPIVTDRRYRYAGEMRTLVCADAYFDGSQDLIVVGGNIVFEPRVLQTLLKAQSALNVVVDIGWRKYWEARMVDPLQDAETLKLDKNRFLIELGQVPEGYRDIQAQFIGLFKVRADFVRSFFDLYKSLDSQGAIDCDSGKRMSVNSYLQWLIDAGWEILAVPVMHGWLKIDHQADLDLYERLQRSGDLAEFCKLD